MVARQLRTAELKPRLGVDPSFAPNVLAGSLQHVADVRGVVEHQTAILDCEHDALLDVGKTSLGRMDCDVGCLHTRGRESIDQRKSEQHSCKRDFHLSPSPIWKPRLQSSARPYPV
jgi:hypothetical protein